MSDEERFDADLLVDFTAAVLSAVGVPDHDARLAGEVLSASDVRGIDSHGVARLPAYVTGVEQGKINPTPELKVVHETPSTATVDGDNGLGLVIGPKANDIAMDKAAGAGTGWVAVRRSNHYGIAGYYVLQAIERDLIGWSMTNASAIAAPLWGAQPRFGTNPIAVGFPAAEEDPVVIDMATTVVAHGKMEIAMRKGTDVPDGWAIDAEGNPTNDAYAVFRGGALLPLGGDHEHGGHKGYALAGLVDLLTGPLAGAGWGPFTPSFVPDTENVDEARGVGIGHFFGAMRVDAFGDAAVIKGRFDDWVRTMRATTPQPGRTVLVPGDPEREAEADRRANGVPLVAQVAQALRDLGERFGIGL